VAPASESGALHTDEGEPIVGRVKTREGTVDLTRSAIEASGQPGQPELRDLTAQDIMADVDTYSDREPPPLER
jgi:hypothetical protein